MGAPCLRGGQAEVPRRVSFVQLGGPISVRYWVAVAGHAARVVCLYWRRRCVVGGAYILAGRGVGDRGIVCVVSSAVVSGTSGSVASGLVIALASFEREGAARMFWEFRCRVAQLVAACRVFLACDNVVLRLYPPGGCR